jgi:hypothetical protein
VRQVGHLPELYKYARSEKRMYVVLDGHIYWFLNIPERVLDKIYSM